jgi:hypothetical protein
MKCTIFSKPFVTQTGRWLLVTAKPRSNLDIGEAGEPCHDRMHMEIKLYYISGYIVMNSDPCLKSGISATILQQKQVNELSILPKRMSLQTIRETSAYPVTNPTPIPHEDMMSERQQHVHQLHEACSSRLSERHHDEYHS